MKRVFDFLNAFRRTRKAWSAADGDRGSILPTELANLGPVAVKLGQTLSQRPDILPEDVCEALKGLQTQNLPFPDDEAFQVIAEDRALGRWRRAAVRRPAMRMPNRCSRSSATRRSLRRRSARSTRPERGTAAISYAPASVTVISI